jgi:regulator of replication initiation timing
MIASVSSRSGSVGAIQPITKRVSRSLTPAVDVVPPNGEMRRRGRHWSVWMARTLAIALPAALFGLLGSLPATAQSPVEEQLSVEAQLEALRAEQQRLADENRRMRTEIDELRSATSDNWLTEQRAAEIRGLVHDVLADSDSRASLLQNGLTAGWSEHFFLASPDGRFKLQLEGQMQIRWVFNYQDARDKWRHGFENTRTKLTFSGHVFNPDLQYLIRGQFSPAGGTVNFDGGARDAAGGEFGLQDAWIQYRLNNNWFLRIGQFQIPFNREELVDSSRQLLVERSHVAEAFSQGRSQGIQFMYAVDEWKVMFAVHDGIEDGLAAQNAVLLGTRGGNTPALTQDVEIALSARFESLLAGDWRQFADFTSPMSDDFGMLFGIGGTYHKGESDGSGSFFKDEGEFYGITTDLSLEFGGASLFASFYYNYIDSQSADARLAQVHLIGGTVEGGVYVAPKWELFGRWEYSNWSGNNTLSVSDLHLISFGTNYYLDGHDAKFTMDLGFSLDELAAVWASSLAGTRGESLTSPTKQIFFRAQFQLLF